MLLQIINKDQPMNHRTASVSPPTWVHDHLLNSSMYFRTTRMGHAALWQEGDWRNAEGNTFATACLSVSIRLVLFSPRSDLQTQLRWPLYLRLCVDVATLGCRFTHMVAMRGVCHLQLLKHTSLALPFTAKRRLCWCYQVCSDTQYTCMHALKT
jgi:hypothetical protein